MRIVAADAHPVVLEMLAKAISKHEDMQLVGIADHGSKLIDLVGQHRPDVAIMGAGMSLDGFDPTACMIDLKIQYPDVKILILSGYNTDPARADELSRKIDDSIQSLAVGGIFYHLVGDESSHPSETLIVFTEQERSVLRLLMDEGKSVATTAHTLGISEKSIQDLMKRMLDNAGIKAPKTPRIRLRHKKKPASPA